MVEDEQIGMPEVRELPVQALEPEIGCGGVVLDPDEVRCEPIQGGVGIGAGEELRTAEAGGMPEVDENGFSGLLSQSNRFAYGAVREPVDFGHGSPLSSAGRQPRGRCP